MKARCRRTRRSIPDLQKLYPFMRLTGPANVLVMPGLQTANISAKLLRELAGDAVIGPMLVGMEQQVQIAAMSATRVGPGDAGRARRRQYRPLSAQRLPALAIAGCRRSGRAGRRSEPTAPILPNSSSNRLRSRPSVGVSSLRRADVGDQLEAGALDPLDIAAVVEADVQHRLRVGRGMWKASWRVSRET